MAEIEIAAAKIREAKSLAILTGAGVSKPSGVPTFRGQDGLWKNYRAEDLATPEAFSRDPELVWQWYEMRRSGIAKCLPNAAHRVIADWSRNRPEVHVITQNIDGLHEAAGTRDVIRLHGTLWMLRCVADCGEPRWEEASPLPKLPPRCMRCGALERPDVVWFGEPLPDMEILQATLATRSDVFLSVGTSSLVYPAANLLPLAKEGGAYTIEINPAATGHSSIVDLAVAESADEALPAIDKLL